MISRKKIEDILRLEDIEGLIESGAPDDEYASEAEDIAIALAKLSPEELTEESVFLTVCSVWGESFELDEAQLKKTVPYLKKIARSILI